MWLFRALTYQLKGIPYRAFLLKLKKTLEMGITQQEVNNSAEDALAESEENFFMPEESLMNDEYNE